MSQWVKFDTEKEAAGSTNSSISGGKFLGLGKHLLRIDSVEGDVTKNGDQYVKIQYSNESGQSIMDRLYPLYGENGDRTQSFKYKSLAHAVLPEDGVLRFEFFTSNQGLLPKNPELFAGLVGLYVEAEVTQGRNGYSIEDDNGTYRLYDVREKDFYKLAGGVPNEFESYAEAREAAKAQGLYRAWNEINKFYASSGHVEDNASAVKSLKESVSAESI